MQLSALKWLFSSSAGKMWIVDFLNENTPPLQPPAEIKGKQVPRSDVAVPNGTSSANVNKCKAFPCLCVHPEPFPSHFQMVPIKSKNPCPNGC